MKIHRRTWDKVFAFSSWLIVFALVYAVIDVFVGPTTSGGPVTNAIGVPFSKVFYSVLYLALAAWLAYSKIRKRKKMRKAALLTIYFVGTFTFILSWALGGLRTSILDNLIIAVAAGGCFLYWKFKTEYVDAKDFERDCDGLREDSPPSRKYDPPVGP